MIRTLVLSAVLVLGVASPAAAQPAASFAEPARPKQSELEVSYLADEGYAAAVVLRCDPAGGPHPKKGKACKALAKAHGDPDKIKPTGAMCTMEYSPITATVKGQWHGKKVDWSKTYGNRCEMERATSDLMLF
ncbi:SSI family serine proteinase inhibitor [Winogradskya consettensis]|nr:SSI family serine proteinase inhibitor [Actinoplanes consettensis]